VFELVRTGLTNAEIAVRLGLSISTVRYHLTNLYAKADAETRDELQSWKPGRRRLRLVTPLTPGIKWLTAAAGVAVVGLGASAAIVALATREGTGDPLTPPTVVDERATDPPSLDDGRVPSVPTLALVRWDGPDPGVVLVDSGSGAELARVATGDYPLVTFRRSRGEVVVSHRADGRAHVVDILDATSGLSLKRRFPAPDRPDYKFYLADWQSLSGDERFFALSTATKRTELPECQGDHVNGPACARNGVRILDLDSEAPQEWWFELDRDCGGGTFEPYLASGFSVTCTSGQTTAFVPDAAGSFEARRLPERNGPGGASHLVFGENGWLGTLHINGASFMWTRPGNDQIRLSAVPAGQIVRWPIIAEVSGGRLVIGYVPTSGDQYPDGLAVFNMVDGAIERVLPGYDIARTIVASGTNTLVAITRDGRLIEIDVETGSSRELAQLDANSEGLTLVR
jgi:hypothetical protein